MKPYIYLDWNIFKYLKSDDSKYDCLRGSVENIKRRYLTPYSEAHIYDLLSKFDDSKLEYVLSDFKTITKYTQNKIIGEDNVSKKFTIKEYAPNIIFNQIRRLKDNHINNLNPSHIAENDPNGIVKIDMDKINKDSPLYNMLQTNNGWYIPKRAAVFQVNQFDSTFDEKDPYRIIRNAVLELQKNIADNTTLNKNPQIKEYIGKSEKFLSLLEVNDIDELQNNFIEAFNEYLELSGESIERISTRNKICIAYALLDFHPLFKEKLRNNNRLSNMLRDSVHAYYAMESKYFVSADDMTINKSNFIYTVFGIDSKALHMNDFIAKFS